MSLFASNNTKKVEIEKDYWVEIKANTSTEEMETFISQGKKVNAGEISNTDLLVSIITLFVVDWNFANAPGEEKFPISSETIKKLRFGIVKKISDAIGENNEDLKSLLPTNMDGSSNSSEKKKEDTPN